MKNKRCDQTSTLNNTSERSLFYCVQCGKFCSDTAYAFGGQLVCESCARDYYQNSPPTDIDDELRARAREASRLIEIWDKRRLRPKTVSQRSESRARANHADRRRIGFGSCHSETLQTNTHPQTAQTHDIFLRAYAVVADKKKKRKRHARGGSKWPRHVVVIDTEARLTADQSLTFAVYRRGKLVDGNYRLIEEGIFYADDLPIKERKVLETYVRTAVSDVASFPPRFPLYSRSEFMKRVFWPAIKRDGAMVVGYNLPFDLARLALAWTKGENNEWSLTMSQYPDGTENRNYPRVLITPIDGKKAFIKLAKPWKPEEWKDNVQVHFLDLRTLAWSLFNRSFSLKTLCKELKTEHQKLDDEPTGTVTSGQIEYARQDGRCTVDALNALKQEFDRHPISLKPYNAYSAASIAKSYLDAMKIGRPAVKFAISDDVLGISLQAYYGGRCEARTRCADMPVFPVDFTSEYPTCCALLRLFDVLTAECVSFEDDTENIKLFLWQITLTDCFDPKNWELFKFFALVQPDNDILPVRTMYNGITQNIGNNYLTSETPIWFAGPDLIASVVQTGRVPKIIRAIRMVPHGKQPEMKSINLRGSMVEIDPYKDDLFRKVIEQRKLHKADEALQYWLKIFANSIYGFFVELIPDTQSDDIAVKVFSGEKTFPDSSDVIENPGPWFFPPLASLITSAGRLLLALLERMVTDAGGTYMATDTDAMSIVSTEKGGLIPCVGGPYRLPDWREAVKALSWKEVKTIIDEFAALNPYDHKIVKGSILNPVDANYVDCDSMKPQRQLYGYSIAAKRYGLYEKVGEEDIEIVDPKAHGVGFLYPPKNSPKGWKKEKVPLWVYEMWDYIVRGALKLKRKEPSWLDLPQMIRLTITTYNVLKMLGEWEIARPYNFLLMPMVDPTFGYAFYRRPNEKVMLVSAFSSEQKRWFEMECVNVHTGKKYRMVDCSEEKEPPYNVVFPSQFKRLVIEYQEHPEAKSLAPNGTPCQAGTSGLLKRAHIIAGEFRYVGKETDRKWEESDDISVMEFKTAEYGRAKRVVASEEVKSEIRRINIKKCARGSGFDRNFVRKLFRGLPVKRNSHDEFVRWLQTYKLVGNEQLAKHSSAIDRG